MKLIDRYIIRAFVVNYMISLGVLMSLFVVVDLLVNLDEFTETDASLVTVVGRVASYYGYNVFLYYSWLAGAITLVAAAFTLGRMVRDNELTAMLSAGTSLYRVVAPVVIAGVLMNVLWVVDQEVIIPRIAHKLARVRDDVSGTRSFGVWFVPDGKGSLVSAGQFSPKSQLMHQVMILDRDASGQTRRFIVADGAEWAPDQHGWALQRGTVHDWRAGQIGPIEMGGRTARRNINVYETDLTPQQIMLRQASQWTSFLSVRQMNELERNGLSNAGIAQLKHSRITQPLVNMLLLLIGVPFFLTREPRAVLASGAQCVAVGGLFFVFAFVSQNMLHSVDYPALPAWLPVLVFGPIVTVMLDSVKT